MNNTKENNKRIKYFFLISHGLPYIVTILLMLIENSFYINNSLSKIIIYGSMLSPLFAVLFMLYYYYDKKEKQYYLKSIIDFKKISFTWLIVIITFPILIRLAGSLIDSILTTNQFQFYISKEMTIGYAIILLFFGPIHEELAWRGVALLELLQKLSFNKSVLYLGFMWAIWHIPLFFIVDTYQNKLGLFTVPFWNFMLGVLSITVIYGLIYIKTNGSILAVILFHYIGNLSGETFVLTPNADSISTVLKIIIAIIIIYKFTNKKIGDLNNMNISLDN
ncbi:MAG: CPBP family intramembrane metalloprotease [Halanaerobiales bacterium]|nr:CPBP family intramembrane metalloprotease [Halanaerobiales bacterium]